VGVSAADVGSASAVRRGWVDQRCCRDPATSRQQRTLAVRSGLQMTSETRKWRTEIRETRGIRVGWQESLRYIEDRMTAAMLELADRLRRRSLHKKEKPHERTSFLGCVAKSLTPPVSYRSTTARTSGAHAGACPWSCRS
jgi:hypothetical protein